MVVSVLEVNAIVDISDVIIVFLYFNKVSLVTEHTIDFEGGTVDLVDTIVVSEDNTVSVVFVN